MARECTHAPQASVVLPRPNKVCRNLHAVLSPSQAINLHAAGPVCLSPTAHCLLPTLCDCLPLPPNLKPQDTEGCLASRRTRTAEGVVAIIPPPPQKSLSSYVVARCTGGSRPAFGL